MATSGWVRSNARCAGFSLALAAVGLFSFAPARADQIGVFAAASTMAVMQDLAADYNRRSGHQLRLTFAASSTLARQIERGAPAQVFLSANRAWMDYLETRGHIDAASRSVLMNDRLALIAPRRTKLTVTNTANLDLPALLAGSRLAIGDPDHVPVGIYAKQALTSLGLWRQIAGSAIRLTNARQVVILVARNETPLGIGYGSDAVAEPGIRTLALFPADAHERMRQRLQSLERIEDDLQVARRIQQSALPERIPYLVGFDVDAFSDSADETGGDTYDVIGYRVDDNGRTIALSVDNADRALLLLADAAGHGIGPALSAAQIRAMLRMAVRNGASLERIVHDVNQQLCDDLFGGRFITAWLAIVDTKNGSLTNFSAGQAPLLHFHADEQRMEVLQADAPPFGILRELAVPTNSPRTMHPGDVFAVLSDGIFETTSGSGEQFGIQRAVDILLAHHEGTAGLMVTRLRQALAQFSPGIKSRDDRTAIIVKREPP